SVTPRGHSLLAGTPIAIGTSVLMDALPRTVLAFDGVDRGARPSGRAAHLRGEAELLLPVLLRVVLLPGLPDREQDGRDAACDGELGQVRLGAVHQESLVVAGELRHALRDHRRG